MLERDNGQIRRALEALARDMENQEAPRHVKAGLRMAFRQRHSKPAWRNPWWMAAAAAVILLASGLLLQRKEPGVVARVPEPAPVAETPPAVIPEKAVTAEIRAAAVRRPKRARQMAPNPAPRRQEVTTEFIPVNGGALPFDRGRLMRVRLPRSAMSSFGLPFDEDRAQQPVKADVLVGEDGMLRAVRFVQ
ncbi:MAG: hypothetical protein ACKV22_26150 [Bryobacteraceae bacterium]